MKTILLIACGAIAREIVSLQKMSCWQHMDIQCLPAHLHNSPDAIPGAVAKKLKDNMPLYNKVYVAFADCGTGGELDRVLNQFAVERLPGAHCYEFFSGSAQFQSLQEQELGTFYLTDFLVQHFQRLVMEGLGILQHPQLLSQYFAHYKRVLYLAQTKNPALEQQAQQCAEQLKLDYEYCYTGLRPMAQALSHGIEEAVVWQN